MLAYRSVALVRIAVAIGLWLGRRAVRAREHRPECARYFNWLIATAPILLLAFGFFAFKAIAARALVAFASLVIGAYLIYAVFDDWSYLRFLLPAMAVLRVFTAVELAGVDRTMAACWRAPILFALAWLVTAHGLLVARSLDTFKLADQLRRVAAVADYINEQIPVPGP